MGADEDDEDVDGAADVTAGAGVAVLDGVGSSWEAVVGALRFLADLVG